MMTPLRRSEPRGRVGHGRAIAQVAPESNCELVGYPLSVVLKRALGLQVQLRTCLSPSKSDPGSPTGRSNIHNLSQLFTTNNATNTGRSPSGLSSTASRTGLPASTGVCEPMKRRLSKAHPGYLKLFADTADKTASSHSILQVNWILS